ncbi:MAG: DUF2127 domain-containing protein [Acidobacteriales bacterium]|nr:DUF2127 domain-containing protein [Terriglobales bacterium]
MAAPTIPHPHAAPAAIDSHSSKAGLRAIATLEAIKGIGVLVLGITLLLLRSRVQDYAESLVYHLHIDFDRRLAHTLLNAAATISDARLWTVVAAIGTYATVRFVEAWGLWNRRVWAEWFALLSGALYLPWEFLKLMEKVDWERVSVLIINLLIVFYMLYIRIRESRDINRLDPAPETLREA